MSELVDVPGGVVTRAYLNFQEYFYPDEYAVGRYFWSFIGLDRSPTGLMFNNADWRFPPQQAHYLRMLAGPHAKTIIRVMQINGKKHDQRVLGR